MSRFWWSLPSRMFLSQGPRATRFCGCKSLSGFEGSLRFLSLVVLKYHSSTLILLPHTTIDQLCLNWPNIFMCTEGKRLRDFSFCWCHKGFSSCAWGTRPFGQFRFVGPVLTSFQRNWVKVCDFFSFLKMLWVFWGLVVIFVIWLPPSQVEKYWC